MLARYSGGPSKRWLLLKQQNVPMFTILGGGENLAGEGTGFLWPAADNRTAAPLGTYAAEDLGYKTIATLAPDYAYGRDAIDGITKAFEAAGGTVAQQQWVPLGTTDMLRYATKFNQNVDALAMWLVPSDAAAFIKEYRDLRHQGPAVLFQGIFDPTYQEIGDQVQGEVGLNEYNHLLDNPANAAFDGGLRCSERWRNPEPDHGIRIPGRAEHRDCPRCGLWRRHDSGPSDRLSPICRWTP